MRFVVAILFFAVSFAAAAEPASDIRGQWLQTLRYGTDSQTLEIVQKIKETEDASFTPELVVLLNRTANPDLAIAVLDLFTMQEVRDGEASARVILAEWQERKSDLVTSAIRYLTALKSEGLVKDLVALIDVSDNQIALAAVSGLGKLQDRSAAASLMEKLISPEYAEGRKSQVILALGELRDPSTVEALIALVRDKNEDAVRRLYAADALGKIGDAKAIPVLKELLAEKEALNRTYAASALAKFDVGEVFRELLQGLRDDNWKVRIECAKALARPLPQEGRAEAIAMLFYKAENDPVSQVKLEAISTLSILGGDDTYVFLLNLYKSQKTPLASREKALAAILGKSITQAAVDTIRGAVESDIKLKDQRALLAQAKALSTAKAPGLKDIYSKFLENSDPFIRIYGIKGIETNGFGDFKDKLQSMAEKDSYPAVQKEAKRVLEKQ
jgi:HEAT repeat protein